MGFENTEEKEQLPTELPEEWVNMTGEKIVLRAGETSIYTANDFLVPARFAQKMKMVGKYNHHEGTMIVGAPDGSMRATPYSPKKEEALKKAGYRQATFTVPSLLGHQRFEDDEIQQKFETLI